MAKTSWLEIMNEIAAQRGDFYLPFEELPPGRYHIEEFFSKEDTKYNTGIYSIFFS